MPRPLARFALVAASLACASASAGAQELSLDRLSLHGYLTQAAGVSSRLPLLGIPTTGTQDYRSAALQLRYAVTDDDHFLMQVGHRRFGESVLTDEEPSVSLAWAFYERKLGALSAKVGKIPMPRGIYNEIRMVGTVLPFYRAPYNFYSESFETIDGLVLAHELTAGEWSLEASAYGGAFDFRQVANSSLTGRQPKLVKARGEHTLGGQLWLGTPIEGLRLGAGGARFRLEDFSALTGTRPGNERSLMWATQADATFERAYARGEFGRLTAGDFRYTAYYMQAGVRPIEQVSFNVQADVADVLSPHWVSPTDYVLRSFGYARDWAVGVNWHRSTSFVLKLEGHLARGYSFDSYVSSQGDPGVSRYGLASVSVAF